jgi:TonB family protein
VVLKTLIGTAARLAVVLAAILAIACGPKAQTVATRPISECTNEAIVGNATATRQKPLYVVAELGYEAPDTARLYAVNLLSEFEKVFRLPSPIHFVAWEGADMRDSTTVPAMANEAALTVGVEGELTSVALTQSSLVTAVDSALLSALRTAVQSGGVLPPVVHGIGKPLVIYVGLTLDPTHRPAPPRGKTSPSRPVVPMRRTTALPVQMLELPVRRFSTLPEVDVERSARVEYPEELTRARLEGEVEFEFVVSHDGSVIPQTIRVIGATERRLAAMAIEAAKGMRVFPGTIKGCPVAVLTAQRMIFGVAIRSIEIPFPPP